jgi:hypothetical protein
VDSVFSPSSSFGSPVGAEDRSEADPVFRPGSSFGSQEGASGADPEFRPGSPFGSQAGPANPAAEAQPGADPLFQPDQQAASYFLSEQPYRPGPSAEPAAVHPSQEPSFLPGHPFGTEPEIRGESEQEKTGPIVPVGTTADNETTGPIRPVRPDGPAGWTLPGT